MTETEDLAGFYFPMGYIRRPEVISLLLLQLLSYVKKANITKPLRKQPINMNLAA